MKKYISLMVLLVLVQNVCGMNQQITEEQKEKCWLVGKYLHKYPEQAAKIESAVADTQLKAVQCYLQDLDIKLKIVERRNEASEAIKKQKCQEDEASEAIKKEILAVQLKSVAELLLSGKNMHNNQNSEDATKNIFLFISAAKDVSTHIFTVLWERIPTEIIHFYYNKLPLITIDCYPTKHEFNIKNIKNMSAETLLLMYRFVGQKGIDVNCGKPVVRNNGRSFGTIGMTFDCLRYETLSSLKEFNDIRNSFLQNKNLYLFSWQDCNFISEQDEKLLEDMIFSFNSSTCLSHEKLSNLIDLCKNKKKAQCFKDALFRDTEIVTNISNTIIDEIMDWTLFGLPPLLVLAISEVVQSQTTGILQGVIGGVVSCMGCYWLGKSCVSIEFGARKFSQLYGVNIPPRASKKWTFVQLSLLNSLCAAIAQKISSWGTVPWQIAEGTIHCLRMLMSLLIIKSIYKKNYSFVLGDLLEHLS